MLWEIFLSGFLMMDIVLNSFMRNEGHPAVSAIATGLNIVLDFLFVMGFKWGMGGAASATCIASIVSVAINGTYSIVKKTDLKLCFSPGKPQHYFGLLKLGLGPAILSVILYLVVRNKKSSGK